MHVACDTFVDVNVYYVVSGANIVIIVVGPQHFHAGIEYVLRCNRRSSLQSSK